MSRTIALIPGFAVGVCLFFASLPAHASLLWDWSYSGDGITADGTFITGNTANAATTR